MNHTFDISVAKQYGILEACIIANFQFWIGKNKANGTNYENGHYWTYNSIKAMVELFPYATERQIRYAIDGLIENGVLIKGNFNNNSHNRTSWYAFNDESIWLNWKMDLTKLANGIDEIVESTITDNKPYINTDNEADDKSSFVTPEIEKPTSNNKPTENDYLTIIRYLNTQAGKAFSAKSEATRRHISARWREGHRVDDFKRVIDIKTAQWAKDEKMSPFLRPETLFGTKFESYLNEVPKEQPKNEFYEKEDGAALLRKMCEGGNK